jgi:hypothetical protein
MTPFESATSQKDITLVLYQFNCDASEIADTGLVSRYPSFSTNYYASLNISGAVYYNVQMIKKDTTSNSKEAGPYKVYLAKNIGIVAYENYPDLKTWIKQ